MAARDEEAIIVGGGIGGLSAALRLHQAGVRCTVYEAAPAFAEIGAGINCLPNAVAVLMKLGLGAEIGSSENGRGIRTSEVRYYTCDGALIVSTRAGYDDSQVPQSVLFFWYSMHRAWLHAMLFKACKERLGEERVMVNHRFIRFEQDDDGVTAFFVNSRGEAHEPKRGSFLVGADGIKSQTRSQLCPGAGATFTGWTCYRGMCEQEEMILDGRTMTLSGRGDCLFVCYPIDEQARLGGGSLTNWGGMVYVGKDAEPPAESWTKRGGKDVVLEKFKDFNVPWGSPRDIIVQTPANKITEYALFDRDPVPQWSFGRVTLLGDAAHPLLPFGSQGAAQAILDADALGDLFAEASVAAMAEGSALDVAAVLAKYDELRNGPSSRVVINNRKMGPTQVLARVHDACPTATRDEKQAWVDAHAAELRNHIKSYKVLQRSLHVVIVGGGIGGLTAAIAIHRVGGMKVTVLEQAPPPGLRELGLGFHLSPNVTKILYTLGLEKEINAKGTSMSKFEKHWADGTLIRGRGVGYAGGFEYPHLGFHRGHFQMLLYHALNKMTGSSSVVRIDSKVERFEEDDDGVDVHFVSNNGKAGVIWRGAVPAENFTVEDLPKDWTRTYGDSTRYYAYYHMYPNLVNWGAAVHIGDAEEPMERWSAKGEKADIMQHFKGWKGPIEQLIENSTIIMKLYVHDRDPLPHWHSEGGRVTLLGDAAHAMLPFAGQGAGSSIEDGLAIAELLKEKTAGADVRAALLKYEQTRLPYTTKLLTYCRDRGGIFEEFSAVQRAINETGKTMKEIIDAGIDWNASKDANSFLRRLY